MEKFKKIKMIIKLNLSISTFFVFKVNCELCCHTMSYRFSKEALPGYCKFCVCATTTTITSTPAPKSKTTPTTTTYKQNRNNNDKSKDGRSTVTSSSTTTVGYETTPLPSIVIQASETSSATKSGKPRETPGGPSLPEGHVSTPVQIIDQTTEKPRSESSSSPTSQQEKVSPSGRASDDNTDNSGEARDERQSSSRSRRSTGITYCNNIYKYFAKESERSGGG